MHIKMHTMKIGQKVQIDKGYTQEIQPPSHQDIEKEHSHRNKETPEPFFCAWVAGICVRFAVCLGICYPQIWTFGNYRATGPIYLGLLGRLCVLGGLSQLS